MVQSWNAASCIEAAYRQNQNCQKRIIMSGLWGEVLIVQFWISANSILEHICGTSGFADLTFFCIKQKRLCMTIENCAAYWGNEDIIRVTGFCLCVSAVSSVSKTPGTPVTPYSTPHTVTLLVLLMQYSLWFTADYNSHTFGAERWD